jgi:hypothetical protein
MLHQKHPKRSKQSLPDRFPKISFRPGWILAYEIPAVANDLQLSTGALICRVLSDFLYAAALDAFFLNSQQQISKQRGESHGEENSRCAGSR